MCHGHPARHSCGHISLHWHYCPAAKIDLNTGYQEQCSNTTMAKEQPSNAGCPLQNCDFKNTNGNWTCCQCGSPNITGWCGGMLPSPRWERNALTHEWQYIQTCDHMCCRNCPREAPAPGSAPESSRKKRKASSKRGTRDPRDGEKKHNKDKESSSKSRSWRH
ncbi:hypothetical protein QBC32DRAFT_383110 [Pseudoneurospora amorphoporcata]|uniref:Uncharacterized protein n=1 Tax=Pseudoneurospora amorphoporcata TaxID=241081 RepID=A0AAN6NKY8_9PEZI|nr:hypothetical protein QBC32DRAFT_383110 [Pseudoneurospora amorphoporcata]